MLSQFDTDLILLITASLSSFTCLISLLLALKLRRQRKLALAIQESADQLSQTINNQRSYTFAFIKRIQALEDQLNKLTDHQQDLEQNIQTSSTYKQALKMAEMGASMEEIVSSCDLGTAEAKLLHNLHGYKALSSKKVF